MLGARARPLRYRRPFGEALRSIRAPG